MERTKAGFTGGEIAAMVAPLFEVLPEDIGHVSVIITGATNGHLQIIGCKHAKYLAEMVVNLDAAYSAFHASTDYESNVYPFKRPRRRIRNWLGGFLL